MSCLSCFILFWNTKYNSPHTFCLANYSVVFHDLCQSRLSRMPQTIQTAYKPLGATPWTNTLPFLIPDNQIGFVWKSAPPVTFHAPWFPCGPVDTHSFPNTRFAVTSTRLISERYLTIVSRLVYMNHCWRSCVGFPPLGVSPHLFFVNGKPPTGQ